MLQKKSTDVGLFQPRGVKVTSQSGSGSMTIKHLDSFVQRESNLAGEEKLRQTTINEAVNDRNVMNRNISRLIYAKGLPSNHVKSHFFKKALASVGNYGRGYQPPIYNDNMVTYLQKEVERIDNMDLEKHKNE